MRGDNSFRSLSNGCIRIRGTERRSRQGCHGVVGLAYREVDVSAAVEVSLRDGAGGRRRADTRFFCEGAIAIASKHDYVVRLLIGGVDVIVPVLIKIAHR